MILSHDTGMMDGTVLEGRYKDSKLSQLELDQLNILWEELRNDADSANLLAAYLDREHEGWQSGEERAETVTSSNDMSRPWTFLAWAMKQP